MAAPADSTDVRTRLVAAAAKLLAEGGPDGVSVRRVAAEIGTSTMAVYTHFGGKPELLRAVSLDGFRHLATRLAEVEPTDDPVADIAALARAYRLSALDDPHLFAAMFGRNVGDVLGTDDERLEALATFITLVEAVQRAIDAGRLDPAPADQLALEVWCGIHGLCTIELGAGLADPDQAPRTLASMGRRMAIGAGDDPARAAASIPDP
ncbi:MAG TPA: TetR/AcrR family transcriptional regulator [Iamia sp.]|jgi:AcrR family transcriptional regulator|nr:TetR/AcrR family transcriptional regulator [Iamia sp.]